MDRELEFFINNQESLVKRFGGKTLVLHKQSVAGVFDNRLEAYTEAKKRFDPGTFMIQDCLPGPEAYTVDVSTLGSIFSA
ncbi:MAG: hypothetical protein FWH50_03540 [Coriobacteriia bacterium]|nr:hypothetical protein [Coriobacteriia bacterium]